MTNNYINSINSNIKAKQQIYSSNQHNNSHNNLGVNDISDLTTKHHNHNFSNSTLNFKQSSIPKTKDEIKIRQNSYQKFSLGASGNYGKK